MASASAGLSMLFLKCKPRSRSDDKTADTLPVWKGPCTDRAKSEPHFVRDFTQFCRPRGSSVQGFASAHANRRFSQLFNGLLLLLNVLKHDFAQFYLLPKVRVLHLSMLKIARRNEPLR